MAATLPSSAPSPTTIAVAAASLVTAGALAYAIYFDHRRRSDPEFRRHLKRQHKKLHRSDVEASRAAEKAQKLRIREAVHDANQHGFPRDPDDTEAYFMTELERGEQMCTDGSDPIDAALCFYKALKVYPQPRELINIYDKTVKKPILDVLAEMIAVDPSISVTASSAGSDAGSATVE